MKVTKKELLYSGKVKSLFATDNPDLLITEFRDDTTAFDGEKKAKLASKGQVNNEINSMIMAHLEKAGVPTHFVESLSPTENLVKHLKMFPLESVVRNIAAGSLCRRLGVESEMKLDPPLQEFFLKNDELHDPLINENHAISFGWAKAAELVTIRDLSLKIHAILTELCVKAGLILVDAKYEFGIDSEGVVRLGDEISPDSCRIWDAKTQKILDKDRFRKGLGQVVASYQEIAERLAAELKSAA
ncbi:MAG: phosphoribosylaminoimidazolesuccinocarboxamide synthase [Gammaproteobacteria bacterium]|nr:phosphoribosylaminoimidazolesuccinocarboxamide synthase [Gammaproteobacteria bacterium]